MDPLCWTRSRLNPPNAKNKGSQSEEEQTGFHGQSSSLFDPSKGATGVGALTDLPGERRLDVEP